MKAKKKQTYQTLISDWNLNRPILASKMPMPVSTFKNKLSDTQTAYHFTEAQEQKLLEILKELSTDIEAIIHPGNTPPPFL
jgi:hypothetical protein